MQLPSSDLTLKKTKAPMKVGAAILLYAMILGIVKRESDDAACLLHM